MYMYIHVYVISNVHAHCSFHDGIPLSESSKLWCTAKVTTYQAFSGGQSSAANRPSAASQSSLRG